MMIMHIILDLMGNDLQNWFMTYLWFGIKMKHLPVWSFIHLCAVFPYSVGPNVSSNALLETKCKCLKSHYWLWEILSICFHSSLSDPNFVRGRSFANIWILASRIELLNTSCRAICNVFWRFRKEWGKYPKRRAKGSFWDFFRPLAHPG